MKKISAVLAFSLVAAAGPALAADPPKPTNKPEGMQSMDHSKMGMSGHKPGDHRKMADDAFMRLDTNKDGSLSKAEFAKQHEMMGTMHGDTSKSHGKMSGDHHKMAGDHHKVAETQFASLDKNRDGRLSESEVPAEHPLATHFDMLDSNKDGSVSKAEFDKHHGM